MNDINQPSTQHMHSDAPGLTRRQALLAGALAVAATTAATSVAAQTGGTSSATAVTQYVEVGGRKLAYR